MARRTPDQAIGARARAVLEHLYKVGEAAGPDLLKALPDIPSYSALRSTLRALESKGLVKHRAVDLRYVYRPAVPRANASKAVLRRVLDTYFAGAPEHAFRTLLDLSRDRDREIDFDALQRLIDAARKEGR
jgi:predicted transcriptional regulator